MTYLIEHHATDGFTLYATVNGHLVHRRYIGYSVPEAKACFTEYLATIGD
jgi:hypothetical protein